jgi:tRNA nucleotidyltransferase (CCA-adding enzyme)
MARLNLAAEAGQMLRQAWTLRAEAPRLVAGLRPSQIYRLLHSYLVEAIAVVAIAEEAPAVREAIASYMQRLRHVRTGVDGETLKSLGVPPGPVYAQVLGGILDARLDGNVSTREEEERLLGALLAAAGSRQ